MVQALVAYLPANSDCLDNYSKAQKDDEICSKVRQFRSDGWPEKHRISRELIHYWRARGELSICDDDNLYGTCIVVSRSTQAEKHTGRDLT